MQFEDHEFMHICHERDDGAHARWCRQSGCGWIRSAPSTSSARPSTSTISSPGTVVIDRSVLRFPVVGVEITCTPLLANFVSVGTGYGMDAQTGVTACTTGPSQ